MSSGRPLAERAGGAAQRRRDRRLRSFLRHERMTVRMALAEAPHHSCGVEPSGPSEALRRQKTASAAGKRPVPLEEVAEPQGGATMVGYMAASVPRLRSHRLQGDDGVRRSGGGKKGRRRRRRRRSFRRPLPSIALFVVVVRPKVLGIMAGLDQKEFLACLISPQWHVQGSCCWWTFSFATETGTLLQGMAAMRVFWPF